MGYVWMYETWSLEQYFQIHKFEFALYSKKYFPMKLAKSQYLIKEFGLIL